MGPISGLNSVGALQFSFRRMKKKKKNKKTMRNLLLQSPKSQRQLQMQRTQICYCV